MSKRVFYISYQPYTLELAKQLHKDMAWKPVFWNVYGNYEQQVQNLFPGVITHQVMDAIKGKLPEGFDENDFDPLDQSLLNELAVHESIVLNMMNRDYISEPITYQERIRLYHRYLRFYLTVLKKLKPDCILFEDTPHQPCNYVLYILAQKMNIKTVLFETSWFGNYIFPMERFEEGNRPFKLAYKKALSEYNGELIPLSEIVKKELEKIRGSYDKGLQNYMKEHVAEMKKRNDISFSKKIKQYAVKGLKLFNITKLATRVKYLLDLSQPSVHHYYKTKGKKMEESGMTNLDYIRETKKIKKIKTDNLQFYRQIQNNNPDLNIPYIYCALHFQPEKSTSPWAGHFVNQFLIIDMLSKAVPDGWKIYVKDHFTQYLYPALGEAFRDKTFYEDVIKLKNVEFVPMEITSFDLIDKAQAVASAAGSALQEAVVREKPALAFGAGHYSWCGGCEGIFYTPDYEKLKEALHKVQHGYKVDYKKVQLFFHMIEQYSYKGYVGGTVQAQRSGMTPEENAKVHAQAILDMLNSNTQAKAI